MSYNQYITDVFEPEYSMQDIVGMNRLDKFLPYAGYCSTSIERVKENLERVFHNFLVDEGAEVKTFNSTRKGLNGELLPLYAIWRGSETPNTLLLRVSGMNLPQGFIGIAGQIKRLEIALSDYLPQDLAIVEVIALSISNEVQLKNDSISKGLFTQRSCVDLCEVTDKKEKSNSISLKRFYSLPSYKTPQVASQELDFSDDRDISQIKKNSNNFNEREEQTDESEFLSWLIEKVGYVSRCICIKVQSKSASHMEEKIKIHDPHQLLQKNSFSSNYQDKLSFSKKTIETNETLTSFIIKSIKEKSPKTQFVNISQIINVPIKKHSIKERFSSIAAKQLWGNAVEKYCPRDNKWRHDAVVYEEDLYCQVISVLQNAMIVKHNFI